ncbi:hypothetical protein niasHT_021110 [Heterodera trifolii]|uniref:Uncharacterized protein n=1 Tax=Heterodera trifolii TaxID=157864 RepID=A0ABD2IWK9_9BILA
MTCPPLPLGHSPRRRATLTSCSSSSSSSLLVTHLFPPLFPLILLLLLHSPSSSAYSSSPGSSFVYQCPMFSYMSPFAINYCGTGSIFHYYVCCDYNPTECCVRLETWAIICLVLIGLLTLFGCLGCCVVCFIMQRR